MLLPIHTVTRPTLLAGAVNGRLPTALLVETPGLAGGPVVRLVEPAARAWRALVAAATAAGHTLKTTSLADSYRPYEVQERTFRQRYTLEVLAGRPYRVWNGQRWYQRPGTAPSAVPGTSNHGWGLAADVGEERDGDTGTESIDSGTVAWLVAHEERFGFSHELQEEPWHIRYWAGDQIPAAVLEFERGDDMTPQELLTFEVASPGLGVTKTVQDWLKIPEIVRRELGRELAGLRTDVALLLDRTDATPLPPVLDEAAFAAAVRAVITQPDVLAAIAVAVADENARRQQS